MKKINNNYANNNSNNKTINTTNKQYTTFKRPTEIKDSFYVPLDASAQSWDPTPTTAAEMINTYGTYEIQPTADNEFMFPAISQGLPSENIADIPTHFHEGIVPKLND